MKPIADVIRDSGLTQQEIAEGSGLSVSLIQKLSTGKRQDVRVSTYLAISEACRKAARSVESKAA